MREVIPKILLPLLLVAVATPGISSAQQAAAAGRPADPIRYTVSFPAPHTHYLEVTASVPTGGKPEIELMMAVWTPGSYLVREYQRNVERVTASAAGRPLSVEKSGKNRWRITTGGAVTITVRDEGCGIAKEHLSRLFERFYRVDKGRSREMGGTGLGLSIVKHIADAHGGSVGVSSTPGVGSTFTILLPTSQS